MRVYLVGFALIVCSFFSGNLYAEDTMADVEIKITQVKDSVYMLEGSGGNIGLSVGPDGVLMIDDQFAPLSEKILAAIKTLSDRDVIFVINTHWHQDHTGGNENFGRHAHIIAHDNVRKRLEAGQKIEFLNKEVAPANPEALPTLTYLSEQFVYFNNEKISVTHYDSGHTDGDSVVYFPAENVLHTGDLFFNQRFPFVDLSSGGSIQGVIRSVEKILFELQPGAKIIPGHGPLGSLDDLKAYYAMLNETTAVITGKMREGLTLDEIIASHPLAAWDEWGKGFISTDRWIELIYQSYRSEAGAAA